MLSVEDRLELHELVGRYGHLIDERRWDDLDQVVTYRDVAVRTPEGWRLAERVVTRAG